MVKVIKSKDLRKDSDCERPFKAGFGIGINKNQNVGTVIGYTSGIAGTQTERHYHINTSTLLYVIKGRSRITIGPEHEQQVVIIEPGDFMFIPKGVIHSNFIIEDSEVIFSYPDVSNEEEAGTMFIEAPKEK